VWFLVVTFFYASITGIEMCHGTPKMVFTVAKQNLAIPSWIKTLTTK
jgi:cytochrome b subunit of formate dehydrogenase